jgi:hypothetical protein
MLDSDIPRSSMGAQEAEGVVKRPLHEERAQLEGTTLGHRAGLPPHGRARVSRVLRLGLVVFCLGVVFTYYLWTASSSGNAFRFGQKQTDYYNLLSDALLAGQLHLLITAPAELARLGDPYDPDANAPYRQYHDVSYFGGRYYLYFGVVPALTLFIPFRLSGIDLPEGFALVLLLFGGVVLQLALVRSVVRRWVPAAPFVLLIACLFLFSFSGFAPFILRRPRVYEVAVASGFFFLSAAALCLGGAREGPPGNGRLAFASLFIGLAIGSRPHHVLAVPFLIMAVVWRARTRYGGSVRRATPELLAAIGPVSLCLAGLLLYNHARFGAWTEFGQTYILGEYNHPRLELFSLNYLPSHLFIYFLAPPTVDLNFPFFHLRPAVYPPLPHPRFFFDPISGLLPCVPLAALGALAPLLRIRYGRQSSFPLILAITMLAQGLLLAAFISCYLGASARYFIDFAPLLLMAAALTWLQLDILLQHRRAGRIVLNSALFLLLAYGTVVNLAISLTGYYDLFRKRNPAVYSALEDRFLPLQKMLLALGPPYGELEIRVRFPRNRVAESEALVMVGRGGAADVLCVRYLDDEHVALRLHLRSGETVRSGPIPIDPGDTQSLIIRMGSLLPEINSRILAKLYPWGEDPARHLSIQMDGQVVLQTSTDFERSHPSEVAIARNAGNRLHCSTPFSGEIVGFRQGRLAERDIARAPVRMALRAARSSDTPYVTLGVRRNALCGCGATLTP